MKAIFLFLFFTFYTHQIFANPDAVEFVFLSEDSLVSLLNGFKGPFLFSRQSAENEYGELECLPMGDGGCFHPQLGYREKEENKKNDSSLNERKFEIDKDQPNKITSMDEINLVDCKKGYYFDIFCGKDSRKENNHAQRNAIEVWIDTSASMRKMDYTKDLQNCYRQRFLKRIQEGCSSRQISFSTFDTSIKEVTDTSMACINYGLNNTKRMIEWIKNSSAKNLYIVTDIDEENAELDEFINSVGGKKHGLTEKKFFSKNLLEFSQNVIKTCQKKQ